MAIVFKSPTGDASAWQPHFEQQIPEQEFRVYPDIGDPAEIDYALIWGKAEGFLKTLPNLKAVFSLGAGVDHFDGGAEMPEGVPLIRMIDKGLTWGMTEFIVMQVLFHHRDMIDYREQQKAKRWKHQELCPPWRRTVGIMGLGVLGSDAAEKLASLRLNVVGWSRSPKSLEGVTCYHGQAQFKEFLGRCEILVNILPLTDATRGVLNADLFNSLPKGAHIINVGRGPHLVDEDLLAALESGQVSAATLDVFHKEPLPQQHPFWSHPRIIVTPHAAADTVPESSTETIVQNIHRLEAGEPVEGLVDLDRGY